MSPETLAFPKYTSDLRIIVVMRLTYHCGQNQYKKNLYKENVLAQLIFVIITKESLYKANSLTCFLAKSREVLHGVGADGGRSEIPHFCSKLLLFALVLEEKREKSDEKKGKMRRKRGKMRKKGGKCVKKGENHSDPIYTNPIKNLPKNGHASGSNITKKNLLVKLFFVIPSDTKLLLTKNNSEIIIFEKLRISRVIPSKSLYFLDISRAQNSSKNYEK